MRILFGMMALLALPALPALSACENGGTDPEDRVPAGVEVVDGNAQQGTAGQALAQPVRVRVVDDRGRPVPGESVNFVVTSGGGAVSVGTVTTDDDGLAATQWTLGTNASAAQRLEARVAGPNGQALVSDPITATARAGLPAKMQSAVPARPQGGSVNGPTLDSLAVRVLDQFDNPVAGVDVQWAVTQGGGSANPTRSASDANGVARAQWILGPTASVVHGAVASVPGAGTVSFTARAADGIAPVQGHNITASGGTTITASVTLGGAPAGPVPGVRVRWEVLSGGGSVAPVESITGSEGNTLGLASTQWTLGPGGGTQTLRATAGTLQTTLTVNVIQQGTRTLVAQVPGRTLDMLGDRVLWLDSAGGTRLFKIRTLSTGADVTVKTDTIRTSFTHVASGYLFNGGALVWSTGSELFEYRGGTLSSLGPYGPIHPSTEGKWVAWGDGTTVFRRDLDAGTTVTIGPGTWPDVAPNGDVAFLNSGAWVYSGGVTTPVSTEGLPWDVQTDGVNIVYTTRTSVGTGATFWLDRPGGDVALAAHAAHGGGLIYNRLIGGWIAYSTPLSAVFRRAPDGTVTQITAETTGTRVEALAPDGTLIYHYPTNSGRYFLVTPAGVKSDVGPSGPSDRVVWRDDRFLLFSGGSVYQLAP